MQLAMMRKRTVCCQSASCQAAAAAVAFGSSGHFPASPRSPTYTWLVGTYMLHKRISPSCVCSSTRTAAAPAGERRNTQVGAGVVAMARTGPHAHTFTAPSRLQSTPTTAKCTGLMGKAPHLQHCPARDECDAVLPMPWVPCQHTLLEGLAAFAAVRVQGARHLQAVGTHTRGGAEGGGFVTKCASGCAVASYTSCATAVRPMFSSLPSASPPALMRCRCASPAAAA
jgi:hypothetical protein